MRPLLYLFVAVALLSAVALPEEDLDSSSPFEGVRWRDQKPEVRLDDDWYVLLSIDRVQTEEILRFLRALYPRDWKDNFETDLVQSLKLMGTELGPHVRLALRSLSTGARVVKARVELTEANLSRILEMQDEERNPDRVAPFDRVTWDGNRPLVQIGKHRGHLISLDGVSTEEILDFCREEYGDRWKKRFVEDLIVALRAMGHPPEDLRVDLVIGDADGKDRVTLVGVRLTAERRAALRDQRSAEDWARAEANLPRVARKHRIVIDPRYAHLARVNEGRGMGMTIIESKESMWRDLDQLEALLVTQYAYAGHTKVDLEAAIDTIRTVCSTEQGRPAFALMLHRFLCLFGDGNLVVVTRDHMATTVTSFRMGEEDGRIFAYVPTGGLLEKAHPFVASIDGVPIGKWVKAARENTPQGGTDAIERLFTLYNLHRIGHLRGELKLAERNRVSLVLVDKEGDSVDVVVTIDPDARTARPGPPVRKSGMLEGDIAYLRLPRMSPTPAVIQELMDFGQTIRDTKGLVLDVRGNAGGSRESLRVIFPFFMRPDEPPVLVNVAALRGPPRTKKRPLDGYLTDQRLYPIRSQVWSDGERERLKRFSGTFKPEWPVSMDGYGELHYMLLRREGDRTYHYDKPVVVLMDGGCLASTEVLLGALKGRPGVTLMGMPSGGGSGRPKPYALWHTELVVQIPTMVSWRPDGRLYDGHGIQPDVVVKPARADSWGASDTMLDAALARLR